MLVQRNKKCSSGTGDDTLIFHLTGIAVNRNAGPVFEPVKRDADAIDHGYLTYDGTGGNDRFGFLVDDGCRRMPVPAQCIQDIGSNG